MEVVRTMIVSLLFSSALTASLKVKQETKTAFFGEDVYIDIPPRDGEVVFRSRSNPSAEVVLLRSGQVVHQRGVLNTLRHLVLEDVKEEDEGVYVIRRSGNPEDASVLRLNVRDCALETVVKYGDTYQFPLSNIQGPITLEFRPSLLQTNGSQLQEVSDPPAVVLCNQSLVTLDEYVGRLQVSERRVVLSGVTMTDEGSFTVLNREGKIRGRNCLNVIKHQNFFHLDYGVTLKINLHHNPSKVRVSYIPHGDHRARPILDQGVLVSHPDPLLDGRLSMEGSLLVLKKTRVADRGMFKVTDLYGYPVADIDVQVNAFKLSNLFVVILSLLGLIGLLLLVCLSSCQYKVHRRNQKNRQLTLIAQQAGKGDGEAFRQVVHDAYTRFTEESQIQSTWEENPTEITEVTIKGLEVSRPGHYQALPSYKDVLEMSDSGVEFPSIGLPLDSDTDGPMTFTSHKLLLDDGVGGLEAAVAADVHLSPARTHHDSATSASPASNARSAADTLDGSRRRSASPGAASRGDPASDSAKMAPEGALESPRE